MATSADTEDDLFCPICMELLVDPNTPKNLPCGHVCCEVCLKQMDTGNTARVCPECWKTIWLPPKEHISELSTNFRLRSVAEKHVEEPKPAKKSGVPICPDHEEEKMNLFCTTCNVLACNICLTLKHRGDEHDIVGFKETCARQREDMTKVIAKVGNSITDGEDGFEMFDQLRGKLNESHEVIEKQIDEFFDSNIEQLNEQRQNLKKKLKQAEDAKLVKVNQKLATVKEEVTSAKQTYEAAIRAMDTVPNYEYITMHSMLIDAMDQIDLRLQGHNIFGLTTHAAVQYVPKTIDMDIGCIVPMEPERPREIKIAQTLDGFEEVLRIAHSATGLLAVNTGNNVIIYERRRDKYERKLNLKLRNSHEYKPRGVAIHPDGRFLVARMSCIEVYSPDGNYLYKIQTAKPGTQTLVVSIATTSDGRILAGDVGRPAITLHDETGNIIKTIKKNVRPKYLTHIHGSHIAVSHWMAGKVSAIDLETELETLSIDIPHVMGICYDEQTECLLVARSEPGERPGQFLLNTGAIEQYSYTTGKLVACLQQGLYDPLGMSLAADGNLVVANEKNVKIYELK